MSKVQKDSEDVFAGIGIFFKIKLQYVFPQFEVKVGEVNFDLTRSN
jgi:hypothetical protein